MIAEVFLKSLQPILLGLIVFGLWRFGRRYQLTSQQGWRLIWLGFVLIFSGALMDIADNHDTWHALRTTSALPLIFFSKMLANIGGSALLAWGVWRWMPSISELLATQRQLCDADDLFCDAPVRASELQKMNVALEQEVLRRQQAEARVLQEKERQFVTLQAIGEGVITLDNQGRVDYINPAAEYLTAWAAHKAVGHHYHDVLERIDKKTLSVLDDLVNLCLGKEGRRYHVDDCVLVHASGDEFNVNISLAQLHDHKNLIIGAVLVLHDLTEVVGIARQLGYQASHDMLTGLMNRREFEHALESALRAGRSRGLQAVMLYIDLDRFKLVNDTCGHRAGDELLVRLAALIKQQVKDQTSIARLGGDEFGVLLENCTLSEALVKAEDIQNALRAFRFVWQEKSFEIGASIGIVPIDSSMRRFTDVMAAADVACYVAKDLGRSRYHVYSPNDKDVEHHHGEIAWVHRITQAFEENRLVLYAQPIVHLDNVTGKAAHYEILMRMQDENGDLISPMAFIPAAERYNLMPSLDRWVVRTTLGHLRQAQGPKERPPINCTVNLSGQSLGDEHFLNFIIEQFHEADVAPECICFEITETAAISNLSRAMKFIEQLRKMGCRFALDDFGTGVSSLTHLKNLNIDYLKIDGSFISDIVHDVVDYTMVESINRIAQVMGLQTIAEYVENDAIIEALQSLRVDFLQGYAIGRPLPLDEVLAAAERIPEYL